MARTLVVSRNFNADANDTFPTGFTNLNGFNGEIRVVNPTGTAGTFASPYISPSEARDTGTFSNNQYAKFTVTGFTSSNTNDQIGICLRLGTATAGGAGVNGYRVKVVDNSAGDRSVRLFRVVSGTETQLGTTQVLGLVDGDTISAEIDGTSITVFHNEVAIPGLTNITDATFSTGKPGLFCSPNGNSTLRGDSYEAGDISSDATPPTLTSPTATRTGATTASGTVSTNEANGTLYRMFSTNSSETVATVKAAALTQTVTATGVQNVTFTGLVANTTYYAHYVHRDAAGNDSTVASSPSFTNNAPVFTGTIADISATVNTAMTPVNTSTFFSDEGTIAYSTSGTWPAGITLNSSTGVISGTPTVTGTYSNLRVVATDPISQTAQSNLFTIAVQTLPGVITTPVLKDNDGAILANETGVVANVYNSTTGALVAHVTGLTSSAGGIVTITDPAIVIGTSYAYEIVLNSNGRRLPSVTAT